MKKFLLAVVLFLTAFPAFAADKETAFDRIMRTGTIRCAYWISPPMLIKDPNTGAMSGAFVDYIEELGKALELKIEWSGEINLSTYIQDLKQGKFDAECSTGWQNALRGKQLEYTQPIAYMPLYVYAKAGNKKFDNNLKALDDPAVRFSGHDGGTNTFLKEKLYPKAELVSITGDAPGSEILNMIKFGKADATLATSFEGEEYMRANPDTIRRVLSEPLRVLPVNISVAMNEFRLVNMLNTATNELMYDGTIEKLFTKYDIGPETLLRVSKPYEVKQ